VGNGRRQTNRRRGGKERRKMNRKGGGKERRKRKKAAVSGAAANVQKGWPIRKPWPCICLNTT